MVPAARRGRHRPAGGASPSRSLPARLFARFARFWTCSIRRQLILGVTVVHAILMTVFVVDVHQRQEGFLHAEALARAEGLSHSLAVTSSSWVAAHDTVGLGEVIGSLSDFPDLRYAMVLAPDGQVLAHTDAARVGRYVVNPTSLALLASPVRVRVLVDAVDLIDVGAPILAGHRLLGWVRVGLGQDRVAATLDDLGSGALVYVVVAVILGMLFAVAMARGVTHGLSALVTVSTRVRSGERALRTRLDRADEIGELGRGFDRMLDALTASEARARLLLDSTAEGICGLGPDGRCTFCNPEAARLLGYDRPEELVGEDLHALTHHSLANGEVCPPGACSVLAALASEDGVHVEHERFRRRDGTWFPVAYSARPLRRGDETLGVVVTFNDVTERLAAEAHVQHLALHDPLTGLPNRTLLNDRLAQRLTHARRLGNRVGVVFLDLDNFKTINDSLGHPAGDRVIREVGHRLAAAVREGDTVSRLGGDEFVVMFDGLRAPEDVQPLVERLRRALATPVLVEGFEFGVLASLGVALSPDDGDNVDTLLRNADAAMYLAKSLGRDNVQYYTEALNPRARDRLALENSLRQAIARHSRDAADADDAAAEPGPDGALAVVYQPQFDLATGRITGVEALCHWRHPERGEVPPATFLPLAEECGLIVPLGAWVLRRACRQLAAWDAVGLPPIALAVNLSPVQLRQEDVVEGIAAILRETGVDPHRLELEITERVLVREASWAVQGLAALKAMGIRLAVDDFGTGCASLAQLKHLAIDRLKLDASILRHLADDGEAVTFVRTIVAMAQGLRLGLVAEGVETAAQLDFLRAAGCGEAQGYLLGPPMSPAEIAARLASGDGAGRGGAAVTQFPLAGEGVAPHTAEP